MMPLHKFPIKKHLLSLVAYFKDPINQSIQRKNWNWIEVLFFHVLISGASGGLAALFQKKILGVFFAVIVTPILTAVTVVFVAYFFYLILKLLLKKESTSFRDLVEWVILVSIPFQAIQIIQGLFPLLTIVGLFCSVALIWIGLKNRYQLSSIFAGRITAAFLAAVFSIWVYNNWSRLQFEKNWLQSPSEQEAPEVEL